MYRNEYEIPAANYTTYGDPMAQNDDRFLFPFLVGGITGGALGYGIANNNTNNNPQVFYPFPPAPMPMQTILCINNHILFIILAEIAEDKKNEKVIFDFLIL